MSRDPGTPAAGAAPVAWRPSLRMSTPSSEIVPELGGSRPSSMRARVDLPQPDSPTMPSTSPRCNRQVDAIDGVQDAPGLEEAAADGEVAGQVAWACDQQRAVRRLHGSCAAAVHTRHLVEDAAPAALSPASGIGAAQAGCARRQRSLKAAAVATRRSATARRPGWCRACHPARFGPGTGMQLEQSARVGMMRASRKLTRPFPARRSRRRTSRRPGRRCAPPRRGRG